MERTAGVRFLGLLLVALVGCKAKGDPLTLSSVAAAGASAGAASDGVVSQGSTAADAGEGDEPPMTGPATPTVSLSGDYKAPEAIAQGSPVVGVTAWSVRVHKQPNREAKLLGFLRGGAWVRATEQSAGPSKECRNGWVGILPGGWVCKDEVALARAGELSAANHPVLKTGVRPPDFGQKLPYMYGTVTRGGPVYARIPTADEVKQHEPGLRKHLAKWRDDEESGARYGLDVWLRYENAKDGDALELLESGVTDPDLPDFLKDHKVAPNLSGLVESDATVRVDQVDRRQGRSFVDTFLIEGRRYNLTPDLLVIPADRFRPIRGSEFHGWPVAALGVEPPFAIVRREGARKFIPGKGGLVDDGDLEYRSLVKLTGKQKFHRGVLHFETTEGFYVDDRHASRVDAAKRWPKWAQQGAKWLDVNLTKQVLVAYEGQKMVYATLVSSGEDGLADPETAKRATIRGIYRIHTKHASVTMDSTAVGEEFELRDVPYVQYFNEGYALHGAYWHDRFGTPKSHGCINLSPEDARRLYFWTEPSVPEGWHGAMKSLTGTILFIHP
jgi:hypothetical protein